MKKQSCHHGACFFLEKKLANCKGFAYRVLTQRHIQEERMYSSDCAKLDYVLDFHMRSVVWHTCQASLPPSPSCLSSHWCPLVLQGPLYWWRWRIWGSATPTELPPARRDLCLKPGTQGASKPLSGHQKEHPEPAMGENLVWGTDVGENTYSLVCMPHCGAVVPLDFSRQLVWAHGHGELGISLAMQVSTGNCATREALPCQEHYLTEYKNQPAMVPRVSNLRTWGESDINLDCKAMTEVGRANREFYD